jgi:hypothetical protein
MDLIEKFNEQIIKKENKHLVKKLKIDIAKWIFKLNEDIDLYKLILNFTSNEEKQSEDFNYLQDIINGLELNEEKDKDGPVNKKIKLSKISSGSFTVEELGYDPKKFNGQLLFLIYIYSTFCEKDVDLYSNIRNSNSLFWYNYFYALTINCKKDILNDYPKGKLFLSELCYIFLMRLDYDKERETFIFFKNTFKPMLEKLKNSNLFTDEKSDFLSKRNEVTNLLETVFCNMFRTRVHHSLEKNVNAFKDEINLIIKALPLIVTTPDCIFHRIVDKFYLTICRTHQSIRSDNIFGAFFLLHFFTATQIYLVFEDLEKYFEF